MNLQRTSRQNICPSLSMVLTRNNVLCLCVWQKQKSSESKGFASIFLELWIMHISTIWGFIRWHKTKRSVPIILCRLWIVWLTTRQKLKSCSRSSFIKPTTVRERTRIDFLWHISSVSSSGAFLIRLKSAFSWLFTYTVTSTSASVLLSVIYGLTMLSL